MISKVTESNKTLIEARIAEINKALEAAGSETRIDSLESYFANIIEISELSTNFHDAPYKFFLMPLDEPLFEIDADKRSIAVPSTFNKNGIGVRGDHMAETLYFRIDRYFDHQDLYNVDEIIINWQFRPANGSRNNELPINTSLALAPDETYDPGHIVFGWVIDKDMTPSKGTLYFSVGFLKRQANEYLYALNTTTASVNVNDSLSLDNPSVLDGMSRPVFERLTNSRYTIDGITPLVDPEYRTDLESISNFNMDENGVEDEKLYISALGRVKDDGKIQYSWNGTEFATRNLLTRAANTEVIPSDYVKTTDVSPEAGIIYFVKQDDEFVQLSENSEPTLADAFADSSLDKYELGSSFVVEKAGTYQVNMQSIKEVSQPDEPTITVRSGNVESTTCIVPHAAIPVVESVTIDTEVDVPYYVVEGQEDIFNNYAFIEGAAPAMVAKVVKDEEAEDLDKGIVEGSSLGAIAMAIVNQEEDIPTVESAEAMSFKVFNEEGHDVVKPLVVKAAKLMVAPADVNEAESQANQDAVGILQNGNKVVVVGKLTELNTFASTNPNQGSAAWVGIDLATNLDSIVGATWNGYELTQDDVDEAASVNLDAGHIIFWAKADDIGSNPRSITIGAEGYADATLEVTFAEPENIAAALADSKDALAEGDWSVYAVNRRNHTYAISEPEVIHISKIAPVVNQIGVTVSTNQDYDYDLIINNKNPGAGSLRTIALDNEHPIRDFKISIADEFANDVIVKIHAVEINKNAQNDRLVAIDENGYAIRKDEPDNNEIDVNVEDGYTFSISDQGYYAIEVVTEYHGSRRITITEPFIVTLNQY